MRHVITLFLLVFGMNMSNGQVYFSVDMENWNFDQYPYSVDMSFYVQHQDLQTLLGPTAVVADKGFDCLFLGNNDTSGLYAYTEIINDTSVRVFGDFSPIGMVSEYNYGDPIIVGIQMWSFWQDSDGEVHLSTFCSEFQSIEMPTSIVTSVDDPMQTNKMVAYPNPASDYVTMPNGSVITDATGRTVRMASITGPTYVGDLCAGMYTVNQQKLIISR